MTTTITDKGLFMCCFVRVQVLIAFIITCGLVVSLPVLSADDELRPQYPELNSPSVGSNQQPEAFMHVTPGDGIGPLRVVCSSRGSLDRDGSIVEYFWNFGDGAVSLDRNPSYTYGSAGTYTVTLTITDDQGATDTAETRVTVMAPPIEHERTVRLTVGRDYDALVIPLAGEVHHDGRHRVFTELAPRTGYTFDIIGMAVLVSN